MKGNIFGDCFETDHIPKSMPLRVPIENTRVSEPLFPDYKSIPVLVPTIYENFQGNPRFSEASAKNTPLRRQQRTNPKHLDFLSPAAKSSPSGFKTISQVPRIPRVPTCNYCKEEGHVVRDCEKTPCRKCGLKGEKRNGHTEEECNTPECSKDLGGCGKFGHLIEECRARLECKECGKIGHISEQCFRNLKCDLCLKRGHSSDKCRSDPWCRVCREEHYPGGCKKYYEAGCMSCGEKGHDQKECKNEYIIRRR